MKATDVEIEDQDTKEIIKRNIFKNPVTDDGVKKSAKGLLQVYKLKGAHGESDYLLKEECTWEEEKESLLKTIYIDGGFHNEITLEQIRNTINNQVFHEANSRVRETVPA
jgi:nicotinamide phosphoribosyltransferase